MSVSLKKLRAYFNDELVVYQGGETHFTALARALKPRIREVLQASREALGLSLDFDPTSSRRDVRLTAPDVIEMTFVSRVITNITARAPAVTTISTPFTYRTVDALFRDDIDVAIVSEAFALSSYPRRHLFDDTVSCMIWSGNQRYGDSLTEREYFNGRHAAMFFTPERTTHPVSVALHSLSAERNLVVRASVYSALPHAIIGTDLIVTTLTRFARLCAETMPLRVLPVPLPLPTIPFVAQWQEYRSSEPVIQWLLGQLDEVAATMEPIEAAS